MTDPAVSRDGGRNPKRESVELLRAHGPVLAQQALQLLAADPLARPVGLILTADAKEAVHLRNVLGNLLGPNARDKGLATLVPRETALTILRQSAPAALDWLAPDQEGDEVRLPLLVATPRGFRLGSVPYPDGEGEAEGGGEGF